MINDIRAQLAAGNRTSFRVKVVPKSSRTEVVGVLPDGTLKVKVAAAPEKGRANKELCSFLALQLGVAKSAVTVQSGHTSPLKTVVVKPNS